MSNKTVAIGDRFRVFSVKHTPEQIEENRNRALAIARRNRERNAARELKESGLLPRDPGSQFAGWQGRAYSGDQNHTVPQSFKKKGDGWQVTKSSEERWQEHLAAVNATMQSLPEKF